MASSVLKRPDASEKVWGAKEADIEAAQEAAAPAMVSEASSAAKEAHVPTVRDDSEDIVVPQNFKYLFTTKTCPNCQLAKEYLQGIEYIVVDAEENMELANAYGVMQAPTLVIVDENGYKKYVNASNIKKYVDQLVEALL